MFPGGGVRPSRTLLGGIMRSRRGWWAALTCCATITMYGGLTVGPASAATAPGTSWSTQTEFTGSGTTLNNTVTTAVDNGEVRLSDQTQAFPFIWIAQSNRGTIAKIDTVTGQVLGEYRSAPKDAAGGYPNPSRTTVTKDGSVWSGNRNIAAVVHVGVAETGQCVDRNHNGVIDTSTGYGDVKDWPTGDASNAQDECILNYVPTYGGDARHLSVDSAGDIWVGNFSDYGYPSVHRFNKVDPSTGTIVQTQETPCGGYGGLIDREGVIWSSTGGYQLLRWDAGAPIVAGENPRCIDIPVYGLAEDSHGNIWASDLSGGVVRKLSSTGGVIGTYPTHVTYTQGLAISQDSTGNDHVWLSSSLFENSSNPVSHLLGDGTWLGNVAGTGAGSTGVAVDAAGKIWTANINSSTAMRIDPDAGPFSTTPGFEGMRVGAVDKTVDFPATTIDGLSMPSGNPYNYSDMTGSSLKGAPDSGTWSGIYDSGTADAEWGTLSWTADVPDGANLTVNIAASNDSSSFGPVTSVTSGTPFAATGRYVKVTVVMDRAPAAGATGSPVLKDITLLPANRPPVADAGSDQAKSEGDHVTLDGTASSDPDSDPITYEWELLAGYAGPAVTLDDATAAQPTFNTTDNGKYTFRLTVTDDDGATASDDVTVTVGNVAPTITQFTAPIDPLPINQPVSMSASFTDPGTADTHTATFSLDGNSVTGDVTEMAGSGSATGSITAPVAGVYVATVTVTDDDGGSDSETASYPVVVYDPSAGFVTGGGWVNSPAGAYPADSSLSGRASFGFVSRYAKGATRPSGNTEFYFQAAGLKLKSTSYDWLVVAGARAQYKGTATVNGVDGYSFMLTAVDGQLSGGGGVDKFRIKIWDGSDTVVYDNQLGELDSAPLATSLSGGSIVIHN